MLQYHDLQHTTSKSYMATGQGRVSKFIRTVRDEIVNRLFTLREVEITIDEKGNRTCYKYTTAVGNSGEGHVS